jgi:hypothetical protein
VGKECDGRARDLPDSLEARGEVKRGLWSPVSLGAHDSEGGNDADLAVYETPTLTREKYEQVVRRLTNGKSHIASHADLPFEGF